MLELDGFLASWVNGLSGKSLFADDVNILLTSFGVPLMVGVVAIQWFRKQERQAVRHTLVAAGLTFLLGLGINQAVLLFIHRMRPYELGLTHLLIPPTADFSFPSDHSTASFSIALTFLLHRQKTLGTAFLLLAILIGFSRIYVGTHYPIDVLGGLATAIIATIIVRQIYRPDTVLDRFVTGIL